MHAGLRVVDQQIRLLLGGFVEQRIDTIVSELSVPEVGHDGAMHMQAIVARAGIYPYRRSDGSVRRELVLPEHLFNPASLATLANAPLTLEHPPEFLEPGNAKLYTVGHVHETIDAVDAPDNTSDFAYARVRLTARTKDAVDRVKSKRPLYTSPGYALPEYQDSPGVHPRWGAYDAIQGPRIYNHLALTDAPRGGSKMLVRTDSADVLAIQERTDPTSWVRDEALWDKAKSAAAEQGKGDDFAYITGIYKQMGGRVDAPQQEDSMSDVVKIDSVDFSLGPAEAAVLRGYLKRRDADVAAAEEKTAGALEQLASLQKQVAELTAKINLAVKAQEEAEGKAAASSAEMMDAKTKMDSMQKQISDPNELRKLLAPRLELEQQAREVLPQNRHDSIVSSTDRQLREAMIRTYLPTQQLEGKSDGFLGGMLEALRGSSPQKQRTSEPTVHTDSAVIPTGVFQVYSQRRRA